MTTPVAETPATVLTVVEWRRAERHHHQLVERLVAPHDARRAAGEFHPVEDFLFTYYRLRSSQLRQWHPGAGIGLLDATTDQFRKFYRRNDDSVTSVDVAAFTAAHADTAEFVLRLLPATAAAPGQFGCFGLHEWAMVHGQSEGELRHSRWPLRLGATGTDAVVTGHQLRCSHFDAFRFFTPSAKPRNLLQPTVWSRTELEQPGCLHTNMDLYKWAYKLVPVVSSALLLDCFQLARDIREVDMRASPYDLTDLGYSPIAIETPTGKAEYVAAQRLFAERGAILRDRLITAIEPMRPYLIIDSHDQNSD